MITSRYRAHQNCLNLGLIPVYAMGHPERYELPDFYVRESKGYINRARIRYYEWCGEEHTKEMREERAIVYLDTCEVETGGSWDTGITFERAIVITTEYPE